MIHLPAAVNRVEECSLDFGKVITGMDSVAIRIGKNQPFILCVAKLADELSRIHALEMSFRFGREQHPSSRTHRHPITASNAPAIGATT